MLTTAGEHNFFGDYFTSPQERGRFTRSSRSTEQFQRPGQSIGSALRCTVTMLTLDRVNRIQLTPTRVRLTLARDEQKNARSGAVRERKGNRYMSHLANPTRSGLDRVGGQWEEPLQGMKARRSDKLQRRKGSYHAMRSYACITLIEALCNYIPKISTRCP
jgi:hypothetical protein